MAGRGVLIRPVGSASRAGRGRRGNRSWCCIPSSASRVRGIVRSRRGSLHRRVGSRSACTGRCGSCAHRRCSGSSGLLKSDLTAFAVLGDEAANVRGCGRLSACEVDHATSVFGEADVEKGRARLGALGGSCHPAMVGEGVSIPCHRKRIPCHVIGGPCRRSASSASGVRGGRSRRVRCAAWRRRSPPRRRGRARGRRRLVGAAG